MIPSGVFIGVTVGTFLLSGILIIGFLIMTFLFLRKQTKIRTESIKEIISYKNQMLYSNGVKFELNGKILY
jgi:hypothetical protein